MKKIAYDTTGRGRKFDSIIFEIFGNISVSGHVVRDTFNPAIITTDVATKEDARYAESEINFAIANHY